MPNSPLSPEAHRERVHALFVEYSPNLRGYILALLPDLTLADDVLQETFLTISRKADTFDLETNFMAWACTIARFKVKEALRSRARHLQSLSDEVIETLSACEPPPDEDEDRRLQLVARCLGKLPEHTRRAFELRYERAHSASQIASVLGWATNSVYVILHRARALVRDCVEKELKNASAP